MTEGERIADQHPRAFDGEAWHGPHVFDVLEGVSATRAARKPIPKAHSIWEIVQHLRTWEDVVLRRLRGEHVDISSAEDWPRVTDTGKKAWLAARAALRQTHDELQREILKGPRFTASRAARGGWLAALSTAPRPGAARSLSRGADRGVEEGVKRGRGARRLGR